MKKKAAVGLAICILAIGAIAFDRTTALSVSTTKTEQIRELLEVTGSGDLGIQVMRTMTEQMRQSVPNVPSEWWDKFMEKIDPEELSELVIPIYEKHFTEAEIVAMLEFYRTPVGRSIISKMPAVTQESMVAGQIWGTKIAREVVEELERDGYTIPTHLR